MQAHLPFPHGASSPACTGLRRLSAGRAVQLRPRRASTFTVVCGQVWATTDAPCDAQARRWGDHMLSAGESLVVMPGERLVVEALGVPVRFDWVVATPSGAARFSRWHVEVAAPGRELARSLRCAAVALGHLGWGVLGYTADLFSHLVAGRGRVLSRFESNPP